MAGVVSRSLGLAVRTVSRRGVHVSAALREKGNDMPDPIDHATGVEKYELLAREAGNDDPFYLKSFSRGEATKDEPCIVNAMDSSRLVGCVCHEDDTVIKWMWLIEGAPKRCECGYWFSLKVHAAPDKFQMPL